jgi:hypothetical protein
MCFSDCSPCLFNDCRPCFSTMFNMFFDDVDHVCCMIFDNVFGRCLTMCFVYFHINTVILTMSICPITHRDYDMRNYGVFE